ncbi:MAG: helix-turn-helix domain-containing protein [Spirochaetaceae bacterium]|jgi:transcriptional regulator with XRE-family HTH domain|nr:helix-turn-helix domain-containing protein [Spirochaetaceae bacterium]
MDEKDVRTLLSSNVRRLRRFREWSQAKLAEKIDVSVNFLADIETGKSWVSSLTLAKLANAFEIAVYELFREPAKDETRDLLVRLVSDISSTLNQSLEKISRRYLP